LPRPSLPTVVEPPPETPVIPIVTGFSFDFRGPDADILSTPFASMAERSGLLMQGMAHRTASMLDINEGDLTCKSGTA
jgi:hypothetical protein